MRNEPAMAKGYYCKGVVEDEEDDVGLLSESTDAPLRSGMMGVSFDDPQVQFSGDTVLLTQGGNKVVTSLNV